MSKIFFTTNSSYRNKHPVHFYISGKFYGTAGVTMTTGRQIAHVLRSDATLRRACFNEKNSTESCIKEFNYDV